MEFFYKYFGRENKISEATGEMHVCCPFPHYNKDGTYYLETNPSAHINTKESIFHCKVCGEGMSEPKFMSRLQGIGYGEALQFLKDMEKADESEWQVWVDNLKNNDTIMQLLYELDLYDMIDELQIGYRGDGLAFPITVYGDRLDVRTYNPNPPEGMPKVTSEKNAKPLIWPFDMWVDDPRPTLLCAGEKDTAIARKFGYNAITFTGGEGSFPKLFKASFRGRKVYIAYDNDPGGMSGAYRAAALLKDAGADPYIVSGHYAVCTEKGEDIHDFFVKYGKTEEDMDAIIEATEPFNEADYEKQRNIIYPLVTLEESTHGAFVNKIVSSRVAVVADFDEVYHVPEAVYFKKFMEPTNNCMMKYEEERQWYLDEKNIGDILKLMDSNLKEKDIRSNLLALAGIPGEKGVAVQIKAKRPVFKAVVTDDFDSEVITEEMTEGTYNPSELLVYTLDSRLKNGDKYRLFYKPTTHPLAAQKVVGIVTKTEQSDTSIEKFQVTEEVKESLKVFRGDVKEKMKELFERAKAICGAETQKEVFYTVELFYHTPLFFKFGARKERGYLEPALVGESRTGKSQTAKKMLELYELGTFTSLKTATVAGLIGGSDKTVGGGFKTRLGVIPRNHKGAVILEELSGGGKEFISRLTDIRSSNKVRIERVSGTTKADAMVRMLSISNQATRADGTTIPLRQYENGIRVLLELIGAAEDIARYDFAVLVGKPEKYTNPNTKLEMEPYDKQAYLNRVRWIWSRKAEQIIIDENVQNYIIECADKLNELYDCHINFFGPEAWKKLTRLAIAVAACVCSTDEECQNLIVTEEHVKWARSFLVACYDNELFKLKQYVAEERKYRECDEKAVQVLQTIYNKHTTLVRQLEHSTEVSQNQLRLMSGLDNEEFNKVINRLLECYFTKFHGEKIVVSERFRKALARIERNVSLQRVGAQ